MTVLANDHLLVTMLIDVCSEIKAPTLAEAVTLGKPKHLFMSIERLEPCPEIYEAQRVMHVVHLDIDPGKPISIAYHTSHIVSDTGRMTLERGYHDGYRQAMIGLLHDKGELFEIEPIVIGAPWLDHPRNKDGAAAIWFARDYGEILPEDIAEFARMKEAVVASADEWMSVMENIPEVCVKKSIASLLKEPSKSDWGGEENDHFFSERHRCGQALHRSLSLEGPCEISRDDARNVRQEWRPDLPADEDGSRYFHSAACPSCRSRRARNAPVDGRNAWSSAKILCDGRSGNISALESLWIAARPSGRCDGPIISTRVT